MDKNSKEASEGKAVVEVLASVLVRLVSSNAHVPSDANVTKFHALKAPAISVHQYLERVSFRLQMAISKSTNFGSCYELLFLNFLIFSLWSLFFYRYTNTLPARPNVSFLPSSTSTD